MDNGKYARLTASLLVRKGEAVPSNVRSPRRRKTDFRPPASLVSVVDEDMVPPVTVFDRTAMQKAPKRQHRIVVVLSEEEHETLGLIAVKKGFTRHQVVRNALNGYFEWLVDEYARSCRCISSTCSDNCDHLSAAEASEHLKDGAAD